MSNHPLSMFRVSYKVSFPLILVQMVLPTYLQSQVIPHTFLSGRFSWSGHFPTVTSQSGYGSVITVILLLIKLFFFIYLFILIHSRKTTQEQYKTDRFSSCSYLQTVYTLIICLRSSHNPMILFNSFSVPFCKQYPSTTLNEVNFRHTPFH